MAAFTATPVDGVEVDFSSSIAVGMPEVVGRGEAVGLVVAAIVLFVMLGTLIGAGLPIVTALIGVAIGVLGAMSLSGVVEMVSVTPVLGMMLGLAVGIDYALFIVNRHRRQLMDGYGRAGIHRPRDRHVRQRGRLRRLHGHHRARSRST